MVQQDIFKILLLILLLSNNQLDKEDGINYSTINDAVILLLLFGSSCSCQNTNTSTQNTTF